MYAFTSVTEYVPPLFEERHCESKNPFIKDLMSSLRPCIREILTPR